MGSAGDFDGGQLSRVLIHSRALTRTDDANSAAARCRVRPNKKRSDFSERLAILIFPNAESYAFFFAFSAFNAKVSRDL